MSQTSTQAAQADVGVIGMAVMGSNLARNMAHKGFKVALYNRTDARTDKVIAEHGSEGTFLSFHQLADFVASLSRPRRVVMMVKAGGPTDAVIDEIVPLLEPGDILVDGGNSFFKDTRRREAALRETGIHYVGTGISGGEVGALEGPSIMPGGSKESYRAIGPVLEKISAHVDGEPCCAWMGTDGAGHFVKMVHNGIEYADMQFIGEAHALLRGVGLSNAEAAKVFASWNTGDLDSYLIEITSRVLATRDPRDSSRDLIDVIVDEAGMKGTGTWTVQSALDLGVDVSTIGEAVFSRAVSSSPKLRAAGQQALTGPDGKISVDDRQGFLDDVRAALWSSKVVAYSQGLDEIRTAAQEYGWQVDMAKVASIWRDGCIIRARLLQRIHDEYAANDLTTLLEAPSVKAELASSQASWRRVVARAAEAGVPVPGFSAALSYYDQVRAPRLNAALTQGLRDLFGAHTYRRVDDQGSWHLQWSGDGSEVSA
ncbi:NADP-dependent phosphogluconate dehydrogenase [Acidipropionibacterium jensenii]|uniref:6-phosphogluconate dehydrogenase, decarboxylating n=1 Tax=Acidipropionibacterium jensenii TaxID=1749 RepID=A0A3S4V440_9ACTN|nr:NADP-dependent phosphogluconate dehydrogenase [Acidipropionibacterium jensenii]MDN5976702.1 NADP-dependent phosphogluconate dehydrogenase [Acidipropionibacterium jensenii]MDN5995277.1 NADP-dependent phosphogluconate dehydrogenase [Acidipropionibacterium jensenii]MDN6440510.1 NADP-dependent phosphogluconate dehydrogenase [Acidipropionibacterium jensenii]MDN6479396.1 NADP-dependent phosphogluconate dehydrogenase [Acidipropionibacterium jensenii]MDN6512603.1 NADP-dependent phosphogluconate deh